MTQISFGSFSDELEKIAKSKYLTINAMKRALRNLNEYVPNDPADIKEAYRTATRQRNVVNVPIQERLKAYKQWKETGEVPQMGRDWNTGGFSQWERGPKSEFKQSNKPVTLYSGGTEEGIRSAVARPMTSIDHPVYVPGQTEVAVRGMYAAPREADALAYAGRGERVGEKLTPTVAELSIPQNQVVQQGYQTVIPYNARGLGIKKLRSKGESRGRVEQAAKKRLERQKELQQSAKIAPPGPRPQEPVPKTNREEFQEIMDTTTADMKKNNPVAQAQKHLEDAKSAKPKALTPTPAPELEPIQYPSRPAQTVPSASAPTTTPSAPVSSPASIPAAASPTSETMKALPAIGAVGLGVGAVGGGGYALHRYLQNRRLQQQG